MQHRQIATVSPSLKITLTEIPEIDVDMYVHHVKAMKHSNLVFVDNEVVYVGLFDSETVAKAKKKLQRLTKKETTNV